jgi:uncharacterized surface protein with fasciclin (FAS1) repeats
MGSPVKPEGNAAQVLASVGTFKSFLAAAKAAGMMPTLESKGPIAVFAPTDGAFARMPKGSLQALMLPRNRAQLKALVANHILEGRLSSTDVLNGRRTVTTLAGRSVEVQAIDPDKGMFYGPAKVTKPDIDATNGSVHAIDRVVLP